MLPVNYAFHSHQIEPYKQEMIRSVEGIHIRPAEIRIFSTVYGKLAAAGDFGPAYWAENIRRPVLFATVIDKLIQEGHRTFLELSPHPVLGPSISQCLASLQVKGTLLASLRRQGDERGTMLDSLATLYVQGRSIAWKTLYPETGRCISLPTYPWHKKSYWIQRDQRLTGVGSGKQTQSRLKPVIGKKQVNSH
jgi:acyl transferase domain-containing protein